MQNTRLSTKMVIKIFLSKKKERKIKNVTLFYV